MRVYWTIFLTYLQEHLTYKAGVVIWLLMDVVPMIVMPALWLSALEGQTQIAGFASPALVSYYMLSFFVSNFTISHIHWDVNVDAKDGLLNIYLARPIPYWGVRFCQNLSWRVLRTLLMIPMVLLGLYVYRQHVRLDAFHLGPLFWLSLVSSHLLSFALTFALGLLSLTLYHVREIFALYYMTIGLLGGQMIPVAMLPAWAQAVNDLLPFRYALSFPIELALGRLQGPAILQGFLLTGAWTLALAALATWMWRAGLKQYSGVGI